jgi:hypothetical protein
MRPFMFLCPSTGYIVQGQADDAIPGEKPHTFHPVTCASCGRSHLVDPVTAELAVGREPRNGRVPLNAAASGHNAEPNLGAAHC